MAENKENKADEEMKDEKNEIQEETTESEDSKVASEMQQLEEELRAIGKQIRSISKHDYRSSFDSELALVGVETYPLKGWIPNPYFIRFQKTEKMAGWGLYYRRRTDIPTRSGRFLKK